MIPKVLHVGDGASDSPVGNAFAFQQRLGSGLGDCLNFVAGTRAAAAEFEPDIERYEARVVGPATVGCVTSPEEVVMTHIGQEPFSHGFAEIREMTAHDHAKQL